MSVIAPELRIRRTEARLLFLAFGFLLAAALALNLAPAVRADRWEAAGGRVGLLILLPVWGLAALAVHRELNLRAPTRDPLLLPTAMLLSGWGVLTIWRVAPGFGARQTIWLTLGVLLVLAILRGPTDLGWLRRFRYLWLSGAILLTSLTLVFGTSPGGVPPNLWLGAFGFYFQPSEVLRLLLIAYIASYLGERFSGDRQPQPRAAVLAPLLVVWGVATLLLLVQRDLGTGTLLFLLLAVLFYLATGRWQVLLISGLFLLLGALLGTALSDLVRLRLQSWLNPWADPTGSSYQQVQSLIAISAGGVFGSGPGLGSPGFVPAVHTDFIYAAILEEWGLLGGLGMLALLALLVGRALQLADRRKDPYNVILAAGLGISFGLQSILIIGGVIRLLPLTGITLPFVSYGGSSLLVSFAALAILLRLSSRSARAGSFGSRLRLVRIAINSGWVLIALTLGWWTLYRAPDLLTRSDNPRRGLASLYRQRGTIYDANGDVLAESRGLSGSYTRHYAPAGSLLGYDSIFYGQAGVEKSMDPLLRGETGYAVFPLAWSRLLYNLPPPGLALRLTIESPLQQVGQQALAGEQGALVLLDASRGAIRALVSSPAYDANQLEADWNELVVSPEAPLLQRSTQGAYQPGAALWLFLSAGAGQQGIDLQALDLEHAEAAVQLNGRQLGCALAEPSAAEQSAADLAARGCPQPLAELGSLLGAEGLLSLLQDFALDRSPAIRLDGGAGVGLRPLVDDLAIRREAIGQGQLTTTPLAMARALAALFNQGKLPALHLVAEVSEPDGAWSSLPPLENETRAISAEAAASTLAFLTDERGMLRLAGIGLVGSANDQLAWHLAGSSQDRWVLVVVLENASAARAWQAADQMLRALGSLP